MWVFLLPNLIGTAGFVLVPFIDVFRRSCYEAVGEEFVGLANYRAVIENRAFRLAAGNTVKFMTVCIPMLLVLSLCIAVMFESIAEQGRRQKTGTGGRVEEYTDMGWIKSGFTLPMAVPAASVVVFFQMLFDEKRRGVLGSYHQLYLEKSGL